MAELKPFRALRYKFNLLTNLICPPYDVIDSEMRSRLCAMSKYNIVNIELPKSSTSYNPYQQSLILLNSWISNGILIKDSMASLYFYEQIFEHNNIKMTRRGFFSLLKLDDHYIKQHEQIIESHKEDRLSLLQETKANISPIFVVFEDSNHIIINLCKEISKKNPQSFARDSNGIFHKLWVVNNTDIINLVIEYFKKKVVFIADGHHRYNTACEYRDKEIKIHQHTLSVNYESNYILTYFCPMEDPGILILPTHRVLLDIPHHLDDIITKYFDVHHTNRDYHKSLAKLNQSSNQAFMIFFHGRYKILTIKKRSFLKRFMPNKSESYRNLAVNILHNILVPNIEASKYVYCKNDKDALLFAQKTGKMAIIFPSIPMQYLKNISLSNEIMPQKTTYFYPKLASGMVIRKF
ncbi:MAG: DUF1015 domain-containing protein [Endomicrobium sp.]|jgi:uncharacterized protein (DUF1015 family)|nr:DUF1015 domain-containing protein [Endomicrobium sp.]